MKLRSLDVWKRLEDHRDRMRDVHLRTLFAHDPNRFDRFSLRLDDLLVDYSKQRITEETVQLLTELARATGVEALRDRMFAGERINATEQRAVLHVALRRPPLAVAACRWPRRHARGGAALATT